MEYISIKIEVKVNLTEDSAKVKQAVENIFGTLIFEEKPQGRGYQLTALTEKLENLAKFSNLLRRERIRDAARRVLLNKLEQNVITFCLNKQVAYAGHVSFCEPVAESPLGPIKVKIQSDSPRKLVDWLAPQTT